MKALFILIILSFLSVTASAVEVCDFDDMWELDEQFELKGIKPSHISKNHNRFKFIEKQMIHYAITLDTWASGATREGALKMFKIGNGVITYYSIDEKTLSFVEYWPGDNHYGAIYEMRGSVYKVIGTIQDGFIYCK